MNNFIFYNPTCIFFGEGEISKLRTVIDKKSKVLIVYGGESFKKYGVYKQTLEALAGIVFLSLVVLSQILIIVPVWKLFHIVSYIKEHGIDFILAVGGRSISSVFWWWAMGVLATAVEVNKTMPFDSILTIAATGLEMNCAS